MMLLRLALALTVATPILHGVVLLSSPAVSYQDPVGLLSHGPLGPLHTLTLALFGIAHVVLSIALGGRDKGWFWPMARALLGASGVMLFYVAYFFASTELTALQGTETFDPLWVVACLIGTAMGLFQPGLKRMATPLAKLNLGCLAAWCLLIPAALLIPAVVSLGAYERVVGMVYVLWIAGVSWYALPGPAGPKP